jgi:hypothetical protein
VVEVVDVLVNLPIRRVMRLVAKPFVHITIRFESLRLVTLHTLLIKKQRGVPRAPVAKVRADDEEILLLVKVRRQDPAQTTL